MKISCFLLYLALATQVFASSETTQQGLSMNEILNNRQGIILTKDKVDASVVTQILEDTPHTQAHLNFAKSIANAIISNPFRNISNYLIKKSW